MADLADVSHEILRYDSMVETRENETMKTLRCGIAIAVILFAIGAVTASTQRFSATKDSAVDPGHTRYSSLTQIQREKCKRFEAHLGL